MAGRKVNLGGISTDPVTRVPGQPDSPAVKVRPGLCIANPRNPRDDVGDLSDLASIAERQLQSCLAVNRRAYLALWPEDEHLLGDARYVIVNGNRRLAAAVKYGRPDLLVVVDDSVAESQATLLRAAIEENLSRRDLDPIEEAKAIMSVVALYATAKEAASAQNWSESWISQRKALLKLAPEVQEMVRAKDRGGDGIPIRDARWLAQRKGVEALTAEQQLALLRQAREAEGEAKRQAKAPPRSHEAAAGPSPQQAEPAPREFPAGNSIADFSPAMRVAPASILEEEAGRERHTGAAREAAVRDAVPEQRATVAPATGTAGGPSVESAAARRMEALARALGRPVSGEELTRHLVELFTADDRVYERLLARMRTGVGV